MFPSASKLLWVTAETVRERGPGNFYLGCLPGLAGVLAQAARDEPLASELVE